MDGWTEDLRGGLGHHSSPSVPALPIKWTKCLLIGTNTQLFDDVPLGQSNTVTFNILFKIAMSSFFLHYKKKEEERAGCIGRACIEMVPPVNKHLHGTDWV